METEIDRFLAHKKKQNEFTRFSSESKGYILKAFAKWIGEGTTAASVTIADIERFYAHVRVDRTISTANTYALALRSFFRWAVEVEKLVRRNPCHGIKLVENDGSARKDFCPLALRDRLIRDLAARLQILGWQIDRAGISKIESQLVWVSDFGLLYLSQALRVTVPDLLPKLDPAKELHENVTKLRTKRPTSPK